MNITTDFIKEEKGKPRGEARRLRYFTLISTELLKSPSIDMDLFISKIASATEVINPELKKYIRQTGIIRSKAVARNYLSFAEWLDFLKVEGRIIVPNSYTVFLSNLSNKNDFSLNLSEKLAFFMKFIEMDDFRLLLKNLTGQNSVYVKDLIQSVNRSEHFIESYFEWLVDLAILKPTRSKFGWFYVTTLGNSVSRDALFTDKVFATYAENLGVKISPKEEPSDYMIWRILQESLEKLKQHIRSEVDPTLFSAYPLVLDIQIKLIIEQGIILSKDEIIKRLKATTPNHNAVFTWDNLANAGYLMISR